MSEPKKCGKWEFRISFVVTLQGFISEKLFIYIWKNYLLFTIIMVLKQNFQPVAHQKLSFWILLKIEKGSFDFFELILITDYWSRYMIRKFFFCKCNKNSLGQELGFWCYTMWTFFGNLKYFKINITTPWNFNKKEIVVSAQGN